MEGEGEGGEERGWNERFKGGKDKIKGGLEKACRRRVGWKER